MFTNKQILHDAQLFEQQVCTDFLHPLKLCVVTELCQCAEGVVKLHEACDIIMNDE